jgi:hypothetical protein
LGSLFYPLPIPCSLFTLEGTSFAEPLTLKARGEDLSFQGGSPSGCEIPKNATALVIQVRMDSPMESPARVKLWAMDSPEPAQPLFKSQNAYTDSTLTILPLRSSDHSAAGEFQISLSDWVKIEGDALGYFQAVDAEKFPGGKLSFFSESTGIDGSDFFGYKAGLNATGFRNLYFGKSAGEGVTPGFSNSGSDNTFIGYNAGDSNTVGSDNVFIGGSAGSSNTSGSTNTFIGRYVGFMNTEGDANSFLGSFAGSRNTEGFANTFIGSSSGGNNSEGRNNSFLGFRSGFSNSEGSYNSAVGFDAGFNNTWGSDNSFFGRSAGLSNKTESNNSFIGAYTNGVYSATNATAIGYRAQVSQSDSLVLGSIDGVNDASSSVNVGIGTTAPNTPLHVSRSDSTAKIILAESTGPEAIRNMMDLKNNGMAQFRLIDTSPNGDAWQFSNTDNNLNISLQGSGSQEFLIENDGDVWINNGTIMVTSYRASKENFRELDSQEILERLIGLPVSDWNYKKDADTVRHIGPVSEDFYELFGYGEGDQHISPNDLSGVAIAAAKGLFKQNQELKAELETLKQEMAEIRALVSK